MANEEIITALRNAIEHGESLEQAMQIMINSGYNPAEVQEASKFVGGALNMQQPRPEENLIMPEQKRRIISGFTKPAFIQQNKFQYSRSPLSKQLQQIKPKTSSYLKEFILIIILLILIGVLVTTIIFKDKILAWFA